MDNTDTSRSCSLCRARKVKCSRSKPNCEQCCRSGRKCVYPTNKPVRFRDQTNAATSRAIQRWRARSTKVDSEPEAVVKRTWTVSPPAEDLARHRFVFDFAETDTSPFAQHLRGLVVEWVTAAGIDGKRDDLLHVTLDAVALMSFSRRHNDYRSATTAARAHSLALVKLSESLRKPGPGFTFTSRDAVAAVLLGLYQSINPEPHMIGSWVHHYCGSVNLLLRSTGNIQQKVHLSRFVTKQAMVASLRMHAMIRMPSQLQIWTKWDDSLHSKTLNLALRTVEFCLNNSRQDLVNIPQPLTNKTLSEALDIEQVLRDHKTRLQNALPYESTPTKPAGYAEWYWELSKHPGCPDSTHVYQNLQAGFTWNTYRVAHFKLLTWLLNSSADALTPGMRSSMLTSALRFAEDVCASVYYTLSQTGDGRPRPTSLEGVPSSAAYGLQARLLIIREHINCSPLQNANAGQLLVSWISKAVAFCSEALAIYEPLCWEEGNLAERQAALAKLIFEDPLVAGSEIPS